MCVRVETIKYGRGTANAMRYLNGWFVLIWLVVLIVTYLLVPIQICMDAVAGAGGCWRDSRLTRFFLITASVGYLIVYSTFYLLKRASKRL